MMNRKIVAMVLALMLCLSLLPACPDAALALTSDEEWILEFKTFAPDITSATLTLQDDDDHTMLFTMEVDMGMFANIDPDMSYCAVMYYQDQEYANGNGEVVPTSSSNSTVKIKGEWSPFGEPLTPGQTVYYALYCQTTASDKKIYDSGISEKYPVKVPGATPGVSISSADIELDSNSFVYTGREIKPAVTVKSGGTTLTKDTDYQLTYANNINVGTGTVTVTGISPNAGSQTLSFKITPRSIAKADLKLAYATAVYTGSALAPEETVTLDGVKLQRDTDYSVSWENNVNAGKAAVTVTGKGNYGESLSGALTISPKDLSTGELTLAYTSAVYTGSAITPEETVTLDGVKLRRDTDYSVSWENNDRVGTATVTVTGKGNYSGSLSGTLTISAEDPSPEDLGAAELTLAYTSTVYTGSAIEPETAVTLNGLTLQRGTDYTVSYANNVNAGTATVTVSGAGRYAGTLTQSFAITAADLRRATVKLDKSSYTYNGKACKPKPTVTWNKITLAPGAEYTVSYSANKDAGTAKVNIKGKGNFQGSATKTFVIGKAANTVKINSDSLTASYKASELSGKSKSFTLKTTKVKGSASIEFTGKPKTSAGRKYITVSKSGKVTISKGIKAGKYEVEIKVRVLPTKNYKEYKLTKTLHINIH